MKAYACVCLRAVLAVIALSTVALGTTNEKELYVFAGANGGGDGWRPQASVITDSHGNLYGTTEYGGPFCEPFGSLGCGTVFELIAPSSPSGVWQEVILYSFHGTDGASPLASLTFDQAGNLYGTTFEGGDPNAGCGTPGDGCGVVFELSPPNPPGGAWTETVLHTFEDVPDGGWPESPVILDSKGNLYGTTAIGGANGFGTAYELSPSSNGWTEAVVYSFSDAGDGADPVGGIVLDNAGNLYGTTQGSATAFELSPATPGQPWTETTIADIGDFANGLVRGKDGNLYGSTEGNSYNPPGTVFQLVFSGGVWTQNVIYSFLPGGGTYGAQAVTVDSNLNIYLPAYVSLCGGVYKLTAMPGNAWKPSVLFSFNPGGTGGCSPVGALTFGKWGALYGVTWRGGQIKYGAGGVVFGLAP